MNEVTVIFPHQLFKAHPTLKQGRPVILVEEQLFFRDWNYPARFHKKKLVFHRASMKAYADRLRDRNFQVHYIDYKPHPRLKYLFDRLKQLRAETILIAEPVDFMLDKRLRRETCRRGLELKVLPSPGFLTTSEQFRSMTAGGDHFRLPSFYRKQRMRLNILIEEGKPAGGKWSYETRNRKRLARDVRVPKLRFPRPLPYVEEAVSYVNRRFADHPGEAEGFFWPVTHKQASEWLSRFFSDRLARFGDYQDAMASRRAFLFHSVISPMLNTGLLTPRQVVVRTLRFSANHSIPLNSLEGFLRQIIGWREFMRGVYESIGVLQANGNFWKHTRFLPSSFYRADTGIDPVDSVLRRVIDRGWCHHAERLMILGNFLLLCEVHPEHVYNWFMEMFIDAYDWAVVPSVYGMSQYADGGLITTRPFVCTSDYIIKTSDFKPGPWCEVWDGLYWRFLKKHRKVFARNPRTKLQVMRLDKTPRSRLAPLLATAEHFLEQLCRT